MTLWNSAAVDYIVLGQPVLLVKRGRISQWGGGKSLNISALNQIVRNPDIPEGHFLRGWFDNGGGRDEIKTISVQSGISGAGWLTFNEAEQKKMGWGKKPDYYEVKGIITLFRKTNPTYKACENKNCYKKVIELHNGHYRCENCEVESAHFIYRMLFDVSTYLIYLTALSRKVLVILPIVISVIFTKNFR